MVPFVVKMRLIFPQSVPEHGFPDYDHPFKAFFLNRSHPSFGVGVQVGALVGKHESSDAFILENTPEGRAKLTAPVMKDDLAFFQPTPFRHGEVPGDLHHPRGVWVGGDSGYMDLLSGNADEEMDVIGDEAEGS
jgi:hypothetical protein